MSELKPCPFCGGEIQVTAYDEDFYRLVLGADYECSKDYLIKHVDRPAAAKAKCPLEMAAYSTEAEAIDAWNTRAERTCHIVKSSRKYVLSDGTELFEDGCSECNGYLGDGDNYCPNCGARQVEEDE